MGGSYEQSDYVDYGAPGSWLNMIHPPNYQRMKLYGKATWFGGDGMKLSMLASHSSNTGTVGRPNRDYDHGHDLVNLTGALRLAGGLDATVRAGYRGYNRRWGEDNYSNGGDLSLRERDGVRQRILPTDLTFTWRHLGDSVLTAGADAQHATYSTYAETATARSIGNDVTASQAGLFVQEKWVSGPFVLRGGGRLAWTGQHYDLISGGEPGVANKSWTNFLWSAGARWNGPISIFVNAGSSFLAPSAKAVGGTLKPEDEGVVGKDGQLPNTALRPESGLGTDAGVELDSIALIHSTSWRWERDGRIVLTYVAWAKDGQLRAGAQPLPKLTPPGPTDPQNPRPAEIRLLDPLAHGLRHLAFLLRTDRDGRVAASLGPRSVAALKAIEPDVAGEIAAP